MKMYKVLPEALELFYSGRISNHTFGCEILGVNCTPSVGEKKKVVFPAHPSLTNSRGDSSIQGVINVSSN